jgi:hypothetical protein
MLGLGKITIDFETLSSDLVCYLDLADLCVNIPSTITAGYEWH